MSALRAAAAAVVVGVALMMPPLVAPALAQSSASVSWPNDGAKVSGWVPVIGKASVGAAGLNRAQMFIGGVLVDEVGPFGCPNERSGADLSYDWNTNLDLSGGGPSANAQHTIKVTTVACGSDPVEDSITAYVNNPPKAPTGVSASVDGKKVTVSWNANREPDIEGYTVVRGDMKTTVTGTSFSEDLAPGTYRYSITALRTGTHGVLTSSAVRSNEVTVGETAPPPSDSSESPTSDSGASPGSGGTSGSSSPSGPKESSSSDPDPGWGAVEEVDYIDYDDDFGIRNSGGSAVLGTFDVGGARLTPLDLPALMTLTALPPWLPPLLPVSHPSDASDPSAGWGQFVETDPYMPPVEVGAESVASEEVYPEQFNVAARSPDRILPPDQMRWMVAGLCALALAGLFLYLDLRLQVGAVGAMLLRRLSKKRSSTSAG